MTAPGGPFAPLARARIPFSPPEPRFLPLSPFGDGALPLPLRGASPLLCSGRSSGCSGNKSACSSPVPSAGQAGPHLANHRAPRTRAAAAAAAAATTAAGTRRILPGRGAAQRGAHKQAEPSQSQSQSGIVGEMETEGGRGRNLAVPVRDRPYPPSTLGNSKGGTGSVLQWAGFLPVSPPCAPPHWCHSGDRHALSLGNLELLLKRSGTPTP